MHYGAEPKLTNLFIIYSPRILTVMVAMWMWIEFYVTAVQTLVLVVVVVVGVVVSANVVIFIVPLNLGHNTRLVYKARLLELATAIDHNARVIAVTLAISVT